MRHCSLTKYLSCECSLGFEQAHKTFSIQGCVVIFVKINKAQGYSSYQLHATFSAKKKVSAASDSETVWWLTPFKRLPQQLSASMLWLQELLTEKRIIFSA